jgi:hypothetical protein
MRTLIVRIFEPAPGAGPVAPRGVVEDVRTGTATRFRGEAQLLAAIMREPGPRDDAEPGEVVGPGGVATPTDARRGVGPVTKERSDEHDV